MPNVSEGRDKKKIEAMAEAIRKVEGVKLLNVDPGQAANRTVYTFAGEPEAVVDAAFALYGKAAELIDMREHEGAHPRMGAVDVCPLIPFGSASLDEAIAWSRILAQRLHDKLGIPGYFYESSAMEDEPSNLAVLRRGEYEKLASKIMDRPPNFGDAANYKRYGLTVLGARPLLIAYNVNLNTDDIEVARKIAAAIRESGIKQTQPDGSRKRINGKLLGVKGIGWFIDDFQKAQVSYNLVDTAKNGMLEVYNATREMAEELGCAVTGSELVGMAPLEEFIKVGKYVLPAEENEDKLVQSAIAYLNLNEVKSFDPQKMILEYRLGEMVG